MICWYYVCINMYVLNHSSLGRSSAAICCVVLEGDTSFSYYNTHTFSYLKNGRLVQTLKESWWSHKLLERKINYKYWDMNTGILLQ